MYKFMTGLRGVKWSDAKPSPRLVDVFHEIHNETVLVDDESKHNWNYAMNFNTIDEVRFLDHYPNTPAKAARHQIRKVFYERLMEYGSKRSFSSANVLDVGCGVSDFSALVFSNKNVTGLDINSYVLAISGLKSKVHGDVLAMPFSSETYDIVLLSYVISELEYDNIPKAIVECARVLRPGGIIAICDDDSVSVETRVFEYAGFATSSVYDECPKTKMVFAWRNSLQPELFVVKHNVEEKTAPKFELSRITGSWMSTLFFQLMVAWVWGSILGHIVHEILK
jgi:SAM-dependent methyltransferase